MRAIIASDWHLGVTRSKAIAKRLQEMQELHDEESIDVIIMLGDYCGGHDGARSVNSVFKMIRDHFPLVPIVATLGNHDYWMERKKYGTLGNALTPMLFRAAYTSILETFRVNDIHFLDEDGPWRFGEFTAIVGHTLWYGVTNPNTNDAANMPDIIDDLTIHAWMSRRAHLQLARNLNQLTPRDQKRIFASHFPIVPSDAPGSEGFAGPTSMYEHMRNHFGIGIFLNGHTHRLACESHHYCVDSDYFKPRFLLVKL